MSLSCQHHAASCLPALLLAQKPGQGKKHLLLQAMHVVCCAKAMLWATKKAVVE